MIIRYHILQTTSFAYIVHYVITVYILHSYRHNDLYLLLTATYFTIMKSTNTIAVEESGVCVYIGVRRCTYFTIMKSTTTGVDECGVCVCVCVYACVCVCMRVCVHVGAHMCMVCVGVHISLMKSTTIAVDECGVCVCGHVGVCVSRY